MTNKSKARHGMSRSYRFKLNPTTRAIRNAFALGLALAAGSGPALAACVAIDANTIECDGALGGVSYTIDDLTLVAGGNLPTVILPGYGIEGIFADGGIGSVSVTSDATILTGGAWSIAAYAEEDVTVVNTGNVFSLYNGAILAAGGGDISVTNGGAITSAAATGADYDLVGIGAFSLFGGDVSVSNELNASIDVVSLYGADASATGVQATSLKYGASVTNAGDISAQSIDGTATGIAVVAYGDASASNALTGSISAVVASDATKYAIDSGSATGISVYSQSGIASATNAGDVTASVDAKYAGDATGILVNSYSGDASVDNTGSVAASTYGKYAGDAIGVSVTAGGAASLQNGVDGTIYASASALDAFAEGAVVGGNSASIDNDGVIFAYATTPGSSATAVGALVYGASSAIIDNSGSIVGVASSPYGNATSFGVYAIGYQSEIVNDYLIEAIASAYGDSSATGAFSLGGTSVLDNNADGLVLAFASSEDGDAVAVGGQVLASDSAKTYNEGTIEASANSAAGNAFAAGSYTASADIAQLTNTGEILAYALSYAGSATAVGAAVAGYDAYTFNSGNSIHVYAETDIGNATASGSITNGVYAELNNLGSITARAVVNELGDATGVGSIVQGGYAATTSNSGYILGYASSAEGSATGIGSVTVADDAVLSNSGDITANGFVGLGDAYAFGAIVSGDYAYAANHETGYVYSFAFASEGSAVAYGVDVYGYYDAALNNQGDIVARGVVYTGDAYAEGSSVEGYNASTINSGFIFAGASSDDGSASAIGSLTSGFYSSLANSGEIRSVAIVGTGNAGAAASVVAGNFASTYNSESGSLEGVAEADFGTATAYGAITGGTYASLDNDGSILAAAYVFEEGDADAFGALTSGYYASTYNSGSITAIADANIGGAYAIGVYSEAEFSYVANAESGDIHAYASVQDGNAYAAGIYASGGQLSLVSNDGNVHAEALAVSGNATAYGALLYTYDGVAGLDNYGSIAAQAAADDGGYAVAIGAQVVAYTAFINNEGGSIHASANTYDGVAIATGAYVSGGYSETYNTGSISADATADYGTSIAIGVESYGNYSSSVINEGGSITATASSYDGLAYATGVDNTAIVYDAYVSNTGTIEANAFADYGFAGAYGVNNYTVLGDSLVSNSGEISGYSYSYAGQAFASGAISGSYLGDATIYNTGSGSISATAYAYGGEASAYGAIAQSTKYTANIANNGDISAAATGGDFAYAVGATASSGQSYAYLTNDGSITATATSDDYVVAIGALVESNYSAYATNTGSIAATATGYVGYAIGLSAESEVGDVVIENGNGGSITATGHGDYVSAIAVNMESGEFNYLFNSGSITAASDSKYSIAVNSNEGAVAEIYNYSSGVITGSIQTGNYADYLYNDGLWNTRQTSYFGGGDDYIYNSGTIVMNSTTIDLGSYAEDGNYFNNEGTIVVRGHSYIDMGENAVADGDGGFDYFANPLPFANNGVLDFLDGAANDFLTIIGDFTGQGSLTLDFSGLNENADVLYVEGDIIEPTRQVVNGVLRSPTTETFTEIPFAYIDGTSISTDFVLGTIAKPTDLFYTLDFSIVSHINAANTSPDVFALGVDVSGLSPRGVLASSIAPGVQNLWHSSIGTVFQREGTVRDQEEMGVAPWVRVFSNSGDVTPSSVRTFGAGGDQTFEQKNSGVEVGVAFNFNQEFSAGLLFGKNQADLNPETGGKAEIDADVYGIYATWTPGTGFYLDGAYRRMNFNTDATVIGGNFESNGSADGYSVEMGYAFTTAGGLKIEPQFQYSTMSIDDLDIVTSGWGDFVISDADSTRMRLGVALRKTFASSDDHSWTPYLSVNAVREEDGDNEYGINGTFFGNNSLGGTSTLVELGATAQMGAWTVFGGLNWQDGDAYSSVVGGQLGVRYAFGRAAPAPAPMVVVAAPTKTCADLDDDGDGVNNCDDKCPASAAGQAVGADGCPLPAAEPQPVLEPKPFRG